METESKQQELKHLGIVRLAAIQALVCVSGLYDYAKRNSGPLRSPVGTVESAVTTVVGPVYLKFKGVPEDLLVFLDKKVDEGSHKFDKHAPPLAKRVASQVHSLIETASQKAQRLINEAQTGGPRAAAHYAAEESKQLLLTNTVKAWYKLNHYALFHTMADMAVPKAAHWSQKYNQAVLNMTKKGYTVFNYLPLVPIDEIAKHFKQQSEAVKKADATENEAAKKADAATENDAAKKADATEKDSTKKDSSSDSD